MLLMLSECAPMWVRYMESELYFLHVCAAPHRTGSLERNTSDLIICAHLQHKGEIDSTVAFAGIVKIKNACVPPPTGTSLHAGEHHAEKICPTFLSWELLSVLFLACLPAL